MPHRAPRLATMAAVIGAALLFGSPPAAAVVEFAMVQNNGRDDAVKASTFGAAMRSAVRCAQSNVDELMIGLAETMLTGVSLESGLEMLKGMASQCIAARKAERLVRSGRYKTPGDIKHHHYLERGIANYGKDGTLSKIARDRRLAGDVPVPPGRNVAVLEYDDQGVRKYLVAVSDDAGHSERQLIAALKHDAPNAKVTRVYSERSPCADGSGFGCFGAMRRDERFSNATIEYGFAHKSDEAAWRQFAAGGYRQAPADPLSALTDALQ